MTDTVDSHFTNRGPRVRAAYDRIVTLARTLGTVREEPKKTSIHLANRTAFAGVATRKDALVLTIKSTHDIGSSRVIKHEQTSANRWHLEIRIGGPEDIDGELEGWLREAYALAG